MLGACAAPVLRHGRYRGERAPQGRRQEGDPALADRDRGRAPHRRAVRDRAVDQRQEPRGASGGSADAKPAPGRRSSGLHARAGRQAVARARPRQGDQVHAQALAGLHAVPRRRTRVHVQQCRRARAARHRAWAEILVVLRIRSRRPTRRRHVQPHRHGQDERRRSAGVARRRPHAHRRPSGSSAR